LKYTSKDLAVIIPTKDRPKQMRKHLQSLLDQQCELGRIIVVASGKNIEDIVLGFNDQLHVEYYSSEPGQIRQRNMGISKLDERTKLVACMDDDVTYNEDAVNEIIRFWNSVEPDTAGVGFKIINMSAIKHNWFRGFLGFSSAKPGQVLKSGLCTPIHNAEKNIRVQWLNGGSTVWRQDILMANSLQEINTSRACNEDLIFSYPLGKKYPLYVCSDAKVEIEEMLYINEQLINKNTKELYIYSGRERCLWNLYFVMINEDLSVNKFILRQLIYCMAQMFKGAIYFDKKRYFTTFGFIKGLFMSSRTLLGLQTVDEFKIEFIDSLE